MLRKLLRLSWRNRLLLGYTFALMGLIRLGLKFLPFCRLWHWVEKGGHHRAIGLQNCSIDRLLWAIEVSSFYMPGQVLCLARALTTHLLMKQAGFSPEIRIGVAKGETDQLEAHAWIESEGKVVIGQLKDLSRYTPLPSIAIRP